MPQDITIAAFILGAVLLLIALLGGGFKIFGAEITGRVGHRGRQIAGVLAMILLLWATFGSQLIARLAQRTGEVFDLTVRVHSADRRDPVITSGKITIDLDNDRRTVPLGGEADFKGIPAKFKDATLKVLPQVDGYEEKWQVHQLTGNVLELALMRAASPVTILTGTISPPPGNGQSVRIFVEGQKSETSADDLGRFELSVNGKPGDRVVVKVYVNGKEVYDDFQVLPGPVTLSLHIPN